MCWTELISWMGAISLLTALGLQHWARTSECKTMITVLNFMGGVCLAAAGAAAGNWSVSVLNGIWCVVCAFGLKKLLRTRPRRRFATFAGPPGSGKTALVQAVADTLSQCGAVASVYNSGATWRLLAIAMQADGIPLEREDHCLRWFDERTPHLDNTGGLHPPVNTTNIDVQAESVATHAKKIARHPRLRHRVVRMMRAFLHAETGAEIMLVDARDGPMLTKGLPAVHFFIDLPLELRGERRSAQTGEALKEVIEKLRSREAADTGFGRLTEADVRAHPNHFVVLDGRKPIETLAEEVAERLHGWWRA